MSEEPATDEMPVTPEQAAEIDLRVERVRKSVMNATFATLALSEPSIRDLFETSREDILLDMFPSGDGRDGLGLSYKAGRRVLDEISDALELHPDTITYPARWQPR